MNNADERPIQNINIKSETHNITKKQGGFLLWLGVILLVLFIFSIFMNLKDAGTICIKTKNCSNLWKAISGQLFLVDFHITQEANYLKGQPYVPVNYEDKAIPTKQAVFTDLMVNILFYISLITFILYVSFLIGGKGLPGIICSLIMFVIYGCLVMVFTWYFTKEIYIPFSCFFNLF